MADRKYPSTNKSTKVDKGGSQSVSQFTKSLFETGTGQSMGSAERDIFHGRYSSKAQNVAPPRKDTSRLSVSKKSGWDKD